MHEIGAVMITLPYFLHKSDENLTKPIFTNFFSVFDSGGGGVGSFYMLNIKNLLFKIIYMTY